MKISTIRKYLEIFSADGVLSRCKSMATACFIADSVNQWQQHVLLLIALILLKHEDYRLLSV